LNARGYSARDERRLLDALGRGLLKEFPNPERSGCPGSDVLRRIAARMMPLAEAEKWLNHLGSCSPCYGDFSQFRKAYELRRKRTLLAVAASILIAIGIAGWVLIQRHNESLVAQTAVLDLRNRSIARGTEPNPGEQPLEVSRAARHWNIYLPLGSNEVSYEVRVIAPSGEMMTTAQGTARLTEQITRLHVEIALTSAAPGNYTLQVSRPGLDWSSYPLRLR